MARATARPRSGSISGACVVHDPAYSEDVARSAEELREFTPRLLHAIQVYFRVERRLTRSRLGFDRPLTWETRNALLESFAMHTRGLADFFYTFKKGRGAADAAAFHFFGSANDWREVVGPPGPWLRRVRFRPEKNSREARTDRFGEQIAHLTYHAEPVSDLASGWPTMQLASEVGTAAWRFINAVDDAHVHPGFKTLASRELPARSKLDDGLLPMLLWTPPTLRARQS